MRTVAGNNTAIIWMITEVIGRELLVELLLCYRWTTMQLIKGESSWRNQRLLVVGPRSQGFWWLNQF